MGDTYRIPPNVRVRITYPDGTHTTYKRYVGTSGDGTRFEDDDGKTVLDNRNFADISIQTDAGWKKIA